MTAVVRYWTFVDVMWLVIVFPVAVPAVTSAELPLPVSATASPGTPRQRLPDWFSGRVLAGSLVAGFVLGAILVAVAWFSFGADLMAPPRDVQLLIPRGTAALLAAGQAERAALPGHPRPGRPPDHHQPGRRHAHAWQLGDQAGPEHHHRRDLAHRQRVHLLDPPVRHLGIIVQARPGLLDGILITILVSVPIGLVLFAGATVFRNLDMEPEAA